jgi:hypothetical protein
MYLGMWGDDHSWFLTFYVKRYKNGQTNPCDPIWVLKTLSTLYISGTRTISNLRVLGLTSLQTYMRRICPNLNKTLTPRLIFFIPVICSTNDFLSSPSLLDKFLLTLKLRNWKMNYWIKSWIYMIMI